MLRIPGRIANFLLGFSSSPDVTILLILLMLMIAGCVLETIAIIVVLMPVLLPVGMNLGFDPVHYGVWVVVALTIGFITPPVGVNLFVASGLTGISITTIARHAVPFVIAMLLAELVIIYVPFLSTWYKLFATY